MKTEQVEEIFELGYEAGQKDLPLDEFKDKIREEGEGGAEA